MNTGRQASARACTHPDVLVPKQGCPPHGGMQVHANTAAMSTVIPRPSSAVLVRTTLNLPDQIFSSGGELPIGRGVNMEHLAAPP